MVNRNPLGGSMTNQKMPTDAEMAAWVREQNRGAPRFQDLDAAAQAWWRERYVIRHAAAAGGRGANSA